MVISLVGPDWRVEHVRGVLFDKDGTLIDSHLYWGRIVTLRTEAILRRYALPEGLYEPLCLAMGYHVARERLLPTGPIALVSREEVIAAVSSFLVKHGVRPGEGELATLFVAVHEAFLDEIWNYVRILPGVHELIDRLTHHGIPLAVVTTDALRNTREILVRLGIDRFFTVIIGKESTAEPKVTGIPARAALRELGVQAGNAVCIGDAPMDIVMAQRSGLSAGIGVASGQVTLESLRDLTPYVVRSLQDLTIIQENA